MERVVKIKTGIYFHFRRTHFKNTLFDYVYFIDSFLAVLFYLFVRHRSLLSALMLFLIRFLRIFGFRYFVYKRKTLTYEEDKYNSILIDKKVEEYSFKNYIWEHLFLSYFTLDILGVIFILFSSRSFSGFLQNDTFTFIVNAILLISFFRTKNYVLTDGIMIKESIF
ncbi:MAG: hypothetical protein LBC92_01860 [Rickettsiales bacterium]|nr:hypothetical protein [Rickettsiales bacterium]